MFFVGIDVGKRHHEACVIDSFGKVLGKTLRFSNTQMGGQKLLQWIQKVDQDLNSTSFALEATGHYWLALHSFLRKQGLPVRVLNPIQSDAFRNLYIRQTKNDTKDAFIIAEVLRFGRYTNTEMASERIVAIRQLSRFRFSLVDSISDLKRQVIGLLDMLFPEYERLFSDLFGKTSSELLLEYTTPEEILSVDTEELAAFIAKHSRNRLGWNNLGSILHLMRTDFNYAFCYNRFASLRSN